MPSRTYDHHIVVTLKIDRCDKIVLEALFSRMYNKTRTMISQVLTSLFLQKNFWIIIKVRNCELRDWNQICVRIEKYWHECLCSLWSRIETITENHVRLRESQRGSPATRRHSAHCCERARIRDIPAANDQPSSTTSFGHSSVATGYLLREHTASRWVSRIGESVLIRRFIYKRTKYFWFS